MVRGVRLMDPRQRHQKWTECIVTGQSSKPVNDSVFFSADDGTNGCELWMTDGTDAGTMLVKDINPEKLIKSGQS